MQNNEFYEIAISYAEKIKQLKPYYFMDSDNAFCVILTDTQELYTGITSVKITDAGVEIVPAEFNATMSMIYDSKAKALQLVVISLTDYKVKIPVDECLDFLTRIESSNKECEILTSTEQSITIEDLKTAFAPMNDDIFKITPDNDEPMPVDSTNPSASVGAPADFAAGFDFDESNPFFAGEGNEDVNTPPPVQAISSKPVNPYENLGAQQKNPHQMNGYQQPYQQQMGGFQQPYQQQMGGYQQPYQQQMGGYQQPYQQQMGGYQQPYQQQMGGYQQPYQQMGGYSQPMSNYSQPYQSANSAYSQQSVQYTPKNTDTDNEDNQSNMMKNRLSNLLGGGGSNPEESAAKPVEPTISREELLKRSKEMKKAVKLNEKMKKQF